MSYDLDIGDRYFNYTWNLSGFFREFMKDGDKEGLECLGGMTGKEAASFLRNALEEIQYDSRKRENGTPTWKYFSEKYDPENYWGDVMSATLFITDLYFASIDNPKRKWNFST